MIDPSAEPRTLAAVLRDGPLGVAAISVLRGAASDLDALHDRGHVYRALTSEAVLVDAGGNGSLPPLHGTPMPGIPETRSDVSEGTEDGALDEPVYRAPEQAAAGVASHRSDIYAFGCIAFEAITGSAPFTLATALDQVDGNIPRASERVDAVPAAVDEVFYAVLSPVPDSRPASAAAVVDALAAASGGRSRARNWPPWLLWAGVGGVLAVIAVVIALAVTTSESPPTPAADPGTRYLPTSPLTVGRNPTDVETGEGFVWVSNSDDGTVSRIDERTGSTTRIVVGGRPAQLVVGDGAVWVRRSNDPGIVRIDPRSGAVSAPLLSGGVAGGMTLGGGFLWLSHRQESTVTRIDTRTLAPIGPPVGVGSAPGPIEFGRRGAYVVNGGEGSISRLDPSTGAVTGVLPLSPRGRLGGIEIDDGTVYVASGPTDVVAIDEETFEVSRTYTFQGWSYFDVSDGTMWVAYDREPAIRRVDVASGDPIGDPIPGFGDRLGRARFADGRLWMTVPGENTVVALAPGT